MPAIVSAFYICSNTFAAQKKLPHDTLMRQLPPDRSICYDLHHPEVYIKCFHVPQYL